MARCWAREWGKGATREVGAARDTWRGSEASSERIIRLWHHRLKGLPVPPICRVHLTTALCGAPRSPAQMVHFSSCPLVLPLPPQLHPWSSVSLSLCPSFLPVPVPCALVQAAQCQEGHPGLRAKGQTCGVPRAYQGAREHGGPRRRHVVCPLRSLQGKRDACSLAALKTNQRLPRNPLSQWKPAIARPALPGHCEREGATFAGHGGPSLPASHRNQAQAQRYPGIQHPRSATPALPASTRSKTTTCLPTTCPQVLVRSSRAGVSLCAPSPLSLSVPPSLSPRSVPPLFFPLPVRSQPGLVTTHPPHGKPRCY